MTAEDFLDAPEPTANTARLTVYTRFDDGPEYYDGRTAVKNPLTGQARGEEGVTIAVDPAVIPYGSKVSIPALKDFSRNGDGIFVAHDTGGAVKARKASNGTLPIIDVFVDGADAEQARKRRDALAAALGTGALDYQVLNGDTEVPPTRALSAEEFLNGGPAAMTPAEVDQAAGPGQPLQPEQVPPAFRQEIEPLDWRTPASADAYLDADSDAPGLIDWLGNALNRGDLQSDLAMQMREDQPRPSTVAALQRLQEDYPASPEYQAFTGAPTFGAALSAFAQAPLQVMTELTAESLVSMLKTGAQLVPQRIAAGATAGAAAGSALPGPGTAAGAALGARVGFAEGMGYTSFALEASGKILETLQERGVNLRDQASLARAFENPALMAEARTGALQKGVPVAIFDGFSAMIGGRLFNAPARSILGKLGQGSAELGVQAGLGMAGEATGQLVAGEELQPGAIAAEGVGELGPGSVEIAAGLATRPRPSAEAYLDAPDEEAPADLAGEEAGLKEWQNEPSGSLGAASAGTGTESEEFTPPDSLFSEVGDSSAPTPAPPAAPVLPTEKSSERPASSPAGLPLDEPTRKRLVEKFSFPKGMIDFLSAEDAAPVLAEQPGSRSGIAALQVAMKNAEAGWKAARAKQQEAPAPAPTTAPAEDEVPAENIPFAKQPDTVVPAREVDRLAGVVRDQWRAIGERSGPTVIVVENVDELTPALAAEEARTAVENDGIVEAFFLPTTTRGGKVQRHMVVIREGAAAIAKRRGMTLEKRVRQLALHELVHFYGEKGLGVLFPKAADRRRYNGIIDGLLSKLQRDAKAGDAQAVDALRTLTMPKEQGGYGYDLAAAGQRAKAAEEYLARWHEEAKAPGSVRKVIAQIKEFLRGIFPRLQWSDADVWSLLDQARQRAEAQAEDTASTASPSFALQPPTRDFAQQLHDWADDTLPERDTLNVGWTPRILRALGAPELQMSLDQSILRKVMEDKHDLTVAELQRLPAVMADPIMVGRQGDSLLVFGQLGSQVRMIALKLGKANQSILVNPIASIYTRTAQQVQDHFKRGEIIYLDERKAPSWLTSQVGNQYAEVAALKEQIPNLKLRSDFVKPPAELKQVDSGRKDDKPAAMPEDKRAASTSGQPSPSGQKAEVIDENTGLPLNADGTVTVYHGTTKEAAAKIQTTGVIRSAAEPDVYFTTAKSGTGYGDGTVIAVRLDPAKLILDDEFPDGRKDFRVEVGSAKQLVVTLDPRDDAPGKVRMSAQPANTPEKRRQFIQKVKDAPATQSLREKVESLYQPISDQTAIDAAKARVNEIGIDAAEREILTRTEPPDKYSNVLGIELMGRLQASGEYDRAAAIAVKIAEGNTSQAQAIQAMAIFARLGPEGIQAYAANVVRKAVESGGFNARDREAYAEIERLKAELAKARAKTATQTIVDIQDLLKGQGFDAQTLARLNGKLRQALLQSLAEPGNAIARITGILIAAGMTRGKAQHLAAKAVKEAQRAMQRERNTQLRALLKWKQGQPAAEALDTEIQRKIREAMIANPGSVWDRYRREAALELGNTAARLADPGERTRTPALQDFTARLLNELKRMLPPDRQPKSEQDGIALLAEAVNNADKYRQVWDAARSYVAEKYRGNPEMLDKLDRLIGHQLARPFSEATIGRAVDDALRKMETSVRELLTRSHLDKAVAKQQLVSLIADRVGLTGPEAASLGNQILFAYAKAEAKAREGYAAGLFKDPIAKVSKGELERWLEMNNAGVLDDSRFYAEIARKYGFPIFTQREAAQIAALQRNFDQAPDGDAKLVAGARMMDAIHSMVPSSVWAKVNAIRNMTMLLNFKTIARNVIANQAMFVVDATADTLNGWVVDPLVSLVTGQRSRNSAQIAARLNGLAQPWRDFWVGVAQGREAGHTGKLQLIGDGVAYLRDMGKLTQAGVWDVKDFGKTFKHTFSSRAGRLFEDGLTLVLGAGDRAFHAAAFQASLAAQMETARANGQEVLAPTPEMIDQALIDANRAIFQDENLASAILTQVKRGLNYASPQTLGQAFRGEKLTPGDFGLGSATIPFAQIPGSIVSRGVEFSPLGFIRASYELLPPQLGRQQPFNQRAFSEAFSRALVGTAGWAIGAWLLRLGIISALPDDDRDLEEMRKSQGLGGLKINVSELWRRLLSGNFFTPAKSMYDAAQDGDLTMNYDWLQPGAFMVAAGAQFAQSGRRFDEKTAQGKLSRTGSAFMAGLLGAAASTERMSVVRNLQQLAQDVGDATRSNQSMAVPVGKQVADLAGSFVPTVIKDLNNLFDNTARESGADFGRHPIDATLNTVAARIPGFAQRFPARYDAFGQAVEKYNYAGNTLFNVMLNPAFTSEVRKDPRKQEIERIFAATGDASVTPTSARTRTVTVNGQQRELSNEELAQFKYLTGRGATVRLEQMLASPAWAAIPDEAKARFVSQTFSDAASAAKILVLGERGRDREGRPISRPGAGTLNAIRTIQSVPPASQ